MPAPWTVGAVLEAAREYLTQKNFSRARLEAELLLAHSLSLSRFDLYTQFDRPLSAGERGIFRNLLKERSSGRPLQHLTGTQGFRRLNLKIGPGVFIPRPETELLVEHVLTLAAADRAPVPILELGAGSGAVCVSLAFETPEAEVWAVDISNAALETAQANAAAHGVAERITFINADLFAGLPADARFKIIVANPPYIPTVDIEGLAVEVRDHEPRAALDGGPSGLDFYRRIVAGAPAHLDAGGALAFEVGEGQAPAVVEILRSGGFGKTEVHKDYAGIERIVMGSYGDKDGDTLDNRTPLGVPTETGTGNNGDT